MMVTPAALAALQVGFRKNFQDAFDATRPEADYTRVATIITSSARSQTYGWLGKFPKMREWVGARVIKDMETHGYTITNKDFEASYLGVRYRLPIDAASDLLKQFCVDIALYRLALSRDVLSEEHRRRYEDTIRHLDRIARGTASLNLPGPADPETGDIPPTAPHPIVAGGPAREFTRDKMRGL